MYKTDKLINYFDLNNKEGFAYYLKDNTVSKFSGEDFKSSISHNSNIVFTNQFFYDTTVTFWRTFFLSFDVSIDEDIYNGTKCYVIKYGHSQLYLDKNTYLPLQKVYQDNLGNKDIENYYYEFGNVTDSDVSKPISE